MSTRADAMRMMYGLLLLVGMLLSKPARAECVYSPSGHLTRIYKGLDSQLITVNTDCPRADRPAWTEGASIWLTDGTAALSATVTRALSTINPSSITLQVNVGSATALTTGLHSWTWSGASKATALRIEVVDSPLVAGVDTAGKISLAISYDQNQKLDRLHAPHAVDGQAVVTPDRGENKRRGANEVYVHNTVTFAGVSGSELDRAARTISSSAAAWATSGQGPQLQRDCDQARNTAKSDCSRDGEGPQCLERADASHRKCSARLVRKKAWIVRPSPPAGNVWLHYDGGTGMNWWNELAELEEVNQLTFAVFGEQPTPIELTVQLVDVSRPLDAQAAASERAPLQTCFDTYNEDGAVAASDLRCPVLLTARVKVAQAARLESLPLPIADLLYVQCGAPSLTAIDPILSCRDQDFEDNTICDGQMRAFDDADLAAGQCRLNYDPGRAAALSGYETPEQLRNVLEIYEQQDIEVTVSRGNAVSATVLWSLDPTEPQGVALPAPPAADTQTGVYRVKAVLSGPSPRAVVYRPSNGSAAVSAKGARVLGDFEFAASLRPRGAYGWTSVPLRTYVTIPVDAFGYRFPASPRYLEASSDPTGVQMVALRTGVLLALEPYDYDTGSNPLPIPLRTLHGFHLYDLSAGSFTPALVNGISMRFPIINLESGSANNQLGTDLSVNAYWEVDLSQAQPFMTSNHFLLTLGASVLSLFGAK